MDQLAELLREAKKAVFFCGAGVSTESGIPDFRSATGLYSTSSGDDYPPEYMLSHSCFARQPEDFFTFYKSKMLYPEVQPNAAHKAMAWFEETGRSQGVVTQNIDGLHQLAGSKTVIELHGSVLRNYCVDCKKTYDLDFIINSDGVPKCTKCSGTVRPDVVLYEEMLNMDAMETAVSMISSADVLIVGGTSLNVYPAAGLVRYYLGNDLVIINKSATSFDRAASLVIREPIGEVLGAAMAQLQSE